MAGDKEKNTRKQNQNQSSEKQNQNQSSEKSEPTLSQIMQQLNQLTLKMSSMEVDLKTELKKNTEAVENLGTEFNQKLETIQEDVEENKEEIRNIKTNLVNNIKAALKSEEAQNMIKDTIQNETQTMQEKIKELEEQNSYLTNLEHMKKRILTSSVHTIEQTDQFQNMKIIKENAGEVKPISKNRWLLSFPSSEKAEEFQKIFIKIKKQSKPTEEWRFLSLQNSVQPKHKFSLFKLNSFGKYLKGKEIITAYSTTLTEKGPAIVLKPTTESGKDGNTKWRKYTTQTPTLAIIKRDFKLSSNLVYTPPNEEDYKRFIEKKIQENTNKRKHGDRSQNNEGTPRATKKTNQANTSRDSSVNPEDLNPEDISNFHNSTMQ